MRQLCENAKQALYIYQLHVVCPTRDSIVAGAASQYTRAFQKLDFHASMAFKKGEARDLGDWASMAVQVRSLWALAERTGRNWQAIRGPAQSQTLMQTPADALNRPDDVAAATEPVTATTQQPQVVVLAAEGTSSVSQQAGAALQAQRDVKTNGAISRGEATAAATAATLPAAAAPPEATAAATPGTPLSQAPPSDNHPFRSSPTGAPEPFALALSSLGLPRSLAWDRTMTLPDPAFEPYDLDVRVNPYGEEDANLIVWDPDGDTAAWIDPHLHLDTACLHSMAGPYAAAQVLIESDSNWNGEPADPIWEQFLLASVDPDRLPAFVQAGIIDIMSQAVLQDLRWQIPDAPGGVSPMRAEAASGVWSRRLVYCRRPDQDCLMGCVQIHWWPAEQDVIPLFAMMTFCTDRFGDGVPHVIGGRVACSADAQRLGSIGQQHQGNIRHSPLAGQTVREKGEIDVQDGDVFVVTYRGTLTPAAGHDQAQSLSEAAAEPTDNRGISHSNAKQAPAPSRSPSAGVPLRSNSPDEDLELARKLKEAHDVLAARYDGRRQEGVEKFDSNLLRKEKRAERSRRAWAKIGKEPPTPKASKSSSKTDRLNYPSLSDPRLAAPANTTGSLKSLPTHPSSNATSAQPAAGKSDSENKPPAQPTAASADTAAEGRSVPAAETSAAAPVAEPAAGAASSSGGRKYIIESASHADEPASELLPTAGAAASGVADGIVKLGQHWPYAASRDEEQADSGDEDVPDEVAASEPKRDEDVAKIDDVETSEEGLTCETVDFEAARWDTRQRMLREIQAGRRVARARKPQELAQNAQAFAAADRLRATEAAEKQKQSREHMEAKQAERVRRQHAEAQALANAEALMR